ncbi:MAG: hypothetical protein IPP37_15640 [Saprospiraceae bacterium]|nr:hypothetical protein [Saprospiraceae bacterium]
MVRKNIKNVKIQLPLTKIMENNNLISRRVLVKSSVLGIISVSFNSVLFGKDILTKVEDNRPVIMESERYPAITEELANEVVAVSHFDLNKLKDLVDKRPELANAAWDWGFGDWETAIGAASHVGRNDIIEYLISKGAKPDIFTFAALGSYSTVKKMIKYMPVLRKTLGPHGISLLQHAKNGESKTRDSKKLIEYLTKLGDADGFAYQTIADDEKTKYVGDYKYGEGEFDGFSVKVNSRNKLLFGKLGRFGGSLLKIGEHTFTYNGAPSVKISFQTTDDQIVSLTVSEPGLTLIANRI